MTAVGKPPVMKKEGEAKGRDSPPIELFRRAAINAQRERFWVSTIEDLQTREQMETYIAAERFREGRPELEEDRAMRLMRISIARDLLERLKRMQKLVLSTKNESFYRSFDRAVRAARNIISESFFSNSAQQIIRDYELNFGNLDECAALCDVPLPGLRIAALEYTIIIGRTIDGINRIER